jgi:hypothetical protein
MPMNKKTEHIIDSYHDGVTERLAAAVNHVAESKAILKKVVGGDPYKLRTFVSEVAQLGLNFYDDVFGWAYPWKKK